MTWPELELLEEGGILLDIVAVASASASLRCAYLCCCPFERSGYKAGKLQWLCVNKAQAVTWT